MSKYRNFIVGLIVGIVICTTTNAFAEDIMQTIEVMFNKVNIVINNKNMGNIGDNYTLQNGVEVPYSISYKGTTYLPVRKVAEIFGTDIKWSQETRTINMLSKEDIKISNTIQENKTKIINKDKDKPKISEINAISMKEIEIEFSEEIDKETAIDLENYYIKSRYGDKKELVIKSATLDNIKRKVILTTEEQEIKLYNVRVKDIKDISGNVMDEYSTTIVGISVEESKEIETFEVKEVKPISSTEIELILEEKVEIGLVTNKDNYTICEKYGDKTELDIKDIKYNADTKKVTITTSKMLNTIYEVNMKNIISIYSHNLFPLKYSFVNK
jgi:hypothetical protein